MHIQWRCSRCSLKFRLIFLDPLDEGLNFRLVFRNPLGDSVNPPLDFLRVYSLNSSRRRRRWGSELFACNRFQRNHGVTTMLTIRKLVLSHIVLLLVNIVDKLVAENCVV